MRIILIPGLWFSGSLWGDVDARLRRSGHDVVALTLPGAGTGSTATLEEQVETVLAAVDSGDRPLVVGHSAAATLAWIAADRRPGKIGRVVLIGGFPEGDGGVDADFFEPVDGFMPFPGWEKFEGPDSYDLSGSDKSYLASVAIPVPEGVPRGVVALQDERRFEVPVVIICPEFTPAQAQAWIAAADAPELAKVSTVDFIDIESGRWPMVTRPEELASILGSLVGDE